MSSAILLPPGSLDIVLELDPERTVVPRIGEPAVYLGARIDKTS